MFGKEITEAARGVWRKKKARVRTQGQLLSSPLWCQPHLCPFQHPEISSGSVSFREVRQQTAHVLGQLKGYLVSGAMISGCDCVWLLAMLSGCDCVWLLLSQPLGAADCVTMEKLDLRACYSQKRGWKTAIMKEDENRVRLKERRRKWFIPKSYIWPVTSVNGFYWLKGLLQQNTDIQQSCEGST